jgi:hypothetical protein
VRCRPGEELVEGCVHSRAAPRILIGPTAASFAGTVLARREESSRCARVPEAGPHARFSRQGTVRFFVEPQEKRPLDPCAVQTGSYTAAAAVLVSARSSMDARCELPGAGT